MTHIDPNLVVPPQDEKLFTLVLNILDVQVPTPAEIIPNHWLRRPTMPEINRIREAFTQFGGPIGQFYRIWYEPRGAAGSTTSSDPNDWRYWVIGVSKAHVGALNDGLNELEEASRLTAVELDCSLQFYPNAGIGMMGRDGVPYFKHLEFRSVPDHLDQSAMKSIQDVHGAIKALPAQRKEVTRAIAMYNRLGALKSTNHLYVLGVFAVIESLLTHDPTGEHDSLGHQIKTKMHLLNRRFPTSLDISAFGGCDFAKLWSKLYSYRSLVAHGRDPDFASQLKILKSADVATKFLDEAAKKLLVLALREYDLISDLQNC